MRAALPVIHFSFLQARVLSRFYNGAGLYSASGHAYYLISPSRIYRFKRFLLCVARVAAPFGCSVHFVNPPATHQDINSQTTILTTITL